VRRAALDHVRSGALISVLDELAGDDVPIHAIWIKTPYIQPKLRAVIDKLIELVKAPNSKFKPG
jgi:DNA-binding transcriptional LysR family regulator